MCSQIHFSSLEAVGPFGVNSLNRRMFQTHKTADEVGGVCYFEYGDNQHAQSSVVSASCQLRHM